MQRNEGNRKGCPYRLLSLRGDRQCNRFFAFMGLLFCHIYIVSLTTSDAVASQGVWGNEFTHKTK